MALTKAEKQKLKKQKRADEKKALVSERKSKSVKKNSVIAFAAVLIVSLGVFIFLSNRVNANYYDDFASCLAERGMVMYGADWCKYTAGQKLMFGKSSDLLDYRDYTETTGISTTPTWEFKEQRYPRAQTFERLSEISGCALPAQ